MRLLILPITELNRDNSVLMMVFDKFYGFFHVFDREQDKLPLLVADHTVVRSELVHIDTRDGISEELLSIGLKCGHHLTTVSIHG
jgi:hypothetical protein